jgi:hypothetical protein
METHIPKYNRIDGILRKITFRAQGAQTLDVSFLETCFTSQRDFVAVRYSTMVCRATIDFISKVT